MKEKPMKSTKKIINVKKGACPTTEPEHNVIPQLKPVPAFVMFTVILVTMTLWGSMSRFPTMLYITYFSTAIVYTNIFKDSLFVNSLAAPFAFFSVADSIADIIYNTGALGVHLPVAIVIIILVNIRKKYDLIIMLTASVIYAVWAYTIFWYFWDIDGPSFSALQPPFNDAEFLAAMCLVGMVSVCTGIWFFRSRCTSPLVPKYTKVFW